MGISRTAKGRRTRVARPLGGTNKPRRENHERADFGSEKGGFLCDASERDIAHQHDQPPPQARRNGQNKISQNCIPRVASPRFSTLKGFLTHRASEWDFIMGTRETPWPAPTHPAKPFPRAKQPRRDKKIISVMRPNWILHIKTDIVNPPFRNK